MGEPALATSLSNEVRRRVIDVYVPIWLRNKPDADVSRVLREDWAFLPPLACYWFLSALDEDVVSISEDPVFGFAAKGGGATHPFGDTSTKLYREAFFTVAAAGMLARQFNWPAERLRFESEKAEASDARHGAFDLVAFADDEQKNVALVAETKWRRQEVEELRRDLESCCARGSHEESEHGTKVNSHRKYRGLVDHKPVLFWIVGPTMFRGGPDLLFGVEVLDGGVVKLEQIHESREFRSPGA